MCLDVKARFNSHSSASAGDTGARGFDNLGVARRMRIATTGNIADRTLPSDEVDPAAAASSVRIGDRSDETVVAETIAVTDAAACSCLAKAPSRILPRPCKWAN